MRWNRRSEIVPAAVLLCGILVLPWVKHTDRSLPVLASWFQAGRSPSPAQAAPEADVSKRPVPEFFIMIDPGHGGDDKGAWLGRNIAEKDITLSWARDLKRQLEERGIPARLLRDYDQTLSLDRRAEIANETRPALYVALHAARPGNGVRIYAPAVPFAGQSGTARFVSWERAQLASLERSKSVARSITVEIRKQDRQANGFAAPLRPLNNLVVPAVAVEFAAMAKPSENQKTQTALASAIASGIAQARGQLGARP
jgi:N-acetylmuramoyl-L-alanine amidase